MQTPLLFRHGLITALALPVIVVGCGSGGPTTPPPPPPPPQVASVVVAPSTLSLLVGQSGTITAQAKDANGTTLAGKTMAWSSSDAATASVSDAGVVIGIAPGSAVITATTSGKSGSSSISVSPVPAASVEVIPQAATVYPSQTRQFVAIVKESAGGTLAGRPVVWSSSNGAVATVSTTGLLTAVSVGPVTVSASVEGKTGTASVTVIPVPVATVSVTPASMELVLGSTGQLVATAKDSAGGPLDNRPPTWTTSNAAVATVSSTGLVQAVTVGSAQITATVEGRSGAALAGSKQFLITAVSPDTLVEGQAGTLVGQGFASLFGTTVLQVDGKPATVGAITNTTVSFTVPTYDCFPTRRVGVSLSIGAAVDSDSGFVKPSQPYFAMPVGQQVVLADPTAYCLQFGKSGATEEYVVGVTNAASSQTAFNSATVASQVGIGQASGPLPSPAAGTINPAADAQYQRYDRHRMAELRIRDQERQLLPQQQSNLASRPDAVASIMGRTPAAIPPSVGDVGTGRIAINGSCSLYQTINVVVRVVSQRLIIVEDQANPAGGLTIPEYQALAAQFDAQTYPTDVNYFGTPTDYDANDRVVAVFTQQVNIRTPDAIAYVRAQDILFSQVDCASSNDGEFFYFQVPDPLGLIGSPIQKASLLTDAPRTFAHELVHIISNSERYRIFGASGFQRHERWIEEGQANFAEEIVGFVVEGRTIGQNYGSSVALGTNNPQGTTWFKSRWYDLGNYFGFKTATEKVLGAPEQCSWMADALQSPCVGGRLIYGPPSSMFRWILDRIGPTYPGGEAAFQRALVKSPLSGLSAVSALSGMTTAEILTQWGAALYTDDKIPGLDGRLTMSSWNLAAIFSSFVATSQLQPRNRGFQAFTDVVGVTSGSSSYHRLSGQGRPASAVRFRTGSGTTLPSYVRVWVARLR